MPLVDSGQALNPPLAAPRAAVPRGAVLLRWQPHASRSVRHPQRWPGRVAPPAILSRSVRTAAGSAVVAAGIAAAGMALVAMLVGCGDPSGLSAVTGTVTLNGRPLADALVRFQPAAGGTPSAAATDAGGRYELRASRSALGASVGAHAVSISTFRVASADAVPPRPARPELVPRKYNAATELTAVVAAGDNTIDFRLDASGTVPQPKPGDY